tara:strand:- start:202 stop:696 length:495 start_codon:yes stop_codon:yes gene_type:complete
MPKVQKIVYAYNINTNRLIRSNTAKYKKLEKLGQLRPLDDPEIKPEIKKEPEKIDDDDELDDIPLKPPKLTRQNGMQNKFDDLEFKKMMASSMSEVIKENEDKFKNISQKKTDKLLKQMLFEKLCQNKKKKPKKSKKTKKKKFVVESDESDESDSESDSSSDSD